jgi:phosphotransferase family enzyme
VELAGAETWIRDHLPLAGAPVVVHERPWGTVMRVPLADGSPVWFKACAPAQAFEAVLTAELGRRWPGVTVDVLAHEPDRAWLLMADAGTRIIELGNPPEVWLRVLPRYAELQRDEASRCASFLEAGVPDLRPEVLPERYDALVRRELPVPGAVQRRLRDFAPTLAGLSRELEEAGIRSTVQHDDLHMGNVYVRDDRARVLDWGDASVGHPFWSLVVTFRFLEERNGLAPGDPWFVRLRDAYLEPWGRGLRDTFALAQRVGIFAHAVAAQRQRDHLSPTERMAFDEDFRAILARALARTTV